MLLFLSAFFVVYGVMHWFFYRLLAAARPPGRLRPLLLFFLLLMVLSPPLVRILEQRGQEPLAWALAWLGYSWMGFIFFFCAAALALSAVAWPLRRWWQRRQPLVLPGEAAPRLRSLPLAALMFWPALLAALLALSFGYREAGDIRLEQVRLASPKLYGFAPDPEAAPWPLERPLRIVKLTDVHLGLIIREKRLAPMLEVVHRARPDILVATGDIVDGQGDNIAHLAAWFREIEAPLGKFAILGNHEFYIGSQESRQFLEAAGFTVLRGESVEIGGRLRIAGVDDRTGVRLGQVAVDQEKRLLAALPPDTYNILLKHQPEVVAGGVVDLQLSGHVHGGQLFPFNIFTWLAYRVPVGLSQDDDGRLLYVGRGSGTWGPPIRFLAPPEVTLIELQQEYW